MKYAIVDGVKDYGDRQVCQATAPGVREYMRRLNMMIERQLGRCAICKRSGLNLFFDHALGRGAGGKHQDDRIWDEQGNPMNAALCYSCNSKKGSKRYSWIDGVYQPIQKEGTTCSQGS